MSEPTTTEPTTEPAAPAAVEVEPTPEPDKPLGENGEKALKSERARAAAAEKERDALKAQLDDIAKQQMTDLERAQTEAADFKAQAEKAATEALRFRIAAKHNITDEDAELFLTGSDEATLTKQAERLSERPTSPSTPKPDLTQGGKPATGASPEDDFASFLQGQLS